MYGCSHNPYKYEIKIYNADQISDLFHNNQQQMNKVKDIMLYYDEVYSLKREGTSTYTVYDKDLKTIKNYLSDYNFCILTDFFKNTGVCRVARRYDVISFLFALGKIMDMTDIVIYTISQIKMMLFIMDNGMMNLEK